MIVEPDTDYYSMPIVIVPSAKHLTPTLIAYFKTVAHEYTEEFIIKRDSYAGHDYITVGANYDELGKLGFSPPYWKGLYDDWIRAGREREDMKILTAQVTEGYETLRGKAEAIANWIYGNVKYLIDREASPWDLVKGAPGDCSSFAPLAMTMLGCAGIDCWGWQGVFWGEPHYGHMTTMARLPEGWVMVDPTCPPVFDVDLRNISAYGYFEIDDIGEAPPVQPPDKKPLFIITPEIGKILPYVMIGLLGTSLVLAAVGK